MNAFVGAAEVSRGWRRIESGLSGLSFPLCITPMSMVFLCHDHLVYILAFAIFLIVIDIQTASEAEVCMCPYLVIRSLKCSIVQPSTQPSRAGGAVSEDKLLSLLNPWRVFSLNYRFWYAS